MSIPLADPQALRARIELIQRRRGDGFEEGIEMEAIAEGFFRLAVDASTPAEEALDLLRRAIRLDAANPKLPYHMARLYFIHGEFERAADWLEHAHTICPTSHRIWAHVTLLQQELNHRNNRDERKEQHALRNRARAIAEAVLAGEDAIDVALLDFTAPDSAAHKEDVERRRRNDAAIGLPPADGADAAAHARGPGRRRPSGASAQRLGDTGLCRWSGVNDLQAEAIMAGEPSRRSQANLSELLAEVTRRRRTRGGGDGAVAIAAIQALVSGYPVAVARPLLAALREDAPTAARDLLELVCAVFEADEADVPRMLAEALDAGRLPSLVAAVIHHRRLLRRPMTFVTLGLAFRTAQAYAAAVRSSGTPEEADVGEATRLVDELLRATRELDVKRRAREPEPEIEVAVTQAPPPSDPAALLAAGLELGRRREQLWARLRELKTARAAHELDARDLSELGQIAAFVEHLATEPARAIGRLDELKAKGAAATAQDGETIEKAIEVYAQLTSRVTPFRKQIAIVAPAPASQPAVAAPVEGAPAPDARPAPEPEAPAGLARLEQVLAMVHRRVEERFAQANATFEPYSPQARRLAPIQALQQSVTAREAEAMYRLGSIAAARRAWSRILRDDGLDLGALKNVAVADAADPDDLRDLGSWRRYAETLYYYDIVAGSPHLRAPARCELHREFGLAYAPSALAMVNRGDAIDALEKIDSSVLIGFLGSRARVRLFVNHTLLEILNAWLRFTSPPLILGVTRTESEVLRTRARDDLLTFVEEVCELAPARVRGPFAELCAERVHAAHRACGSPERLTRERDPAYDAEIADHVALIKRICELKYRLWVLMTAGTNPDTVTRVERLDVLNDLARLDCVPIAGSAELLRRAAGDLGIEPAVFPRMLSRARTLLLDHAGSEERAVRAALAAVATDDREANLARLACGLAIGCARETGSAARVPELLRTIQGWLERAQAVVEREGEAGVLEDDQPLTPDDIYKVAVALDNAAAGVSVADFGTWDQDTDWGAIVEVMDALIASSGFVAGGSEAYRLRMIARVNGLATARDQTEHRARLEAIAADARVVKERSAEADEREDAERTLGQVVAALG